MNGQERHLTENEKIEAVVDPGTVPRRNRLHLEACAACRADCAALDRSLECLGNIAETSAPAPVRRFQFPEAQPGIRAGGLWKPALALCLTVFVLIAGVYLEHGRQPHDLTVDQLMTEMEADRKLLFEVSRIEENVLFDVLPYPVDDEPDLLDDSFLEFMAPVEPETTGADDLSNAFSTILS